MYTVAIDLALAAGITALLILVALFSQGAGIQFVYFAF
jgi:hypothetical protein